MPKSRKGKLFDVPTRTRKAKKLRAMLRNFLQCDLSGMRAIDIGCSTGVITSVLGADLNEIVGIDVDAWSVQHASADGERTSAYFLVADGLDVPFPSENFDLVVCAQCYEHVANARQLSDEVFRLLKPGGVCVFSGPNRLAPIEDHYGLPLLSWFPRPLANIYMRLMGRGQSYEEHPLTLWELKRLWRKFYITDYTVKMIQDPVEYSVEDEVGSSAWLGKLPAWLLNMLLVFAPNYNWIMVKPLQATEPL